MVGGGGWWGMVGGWYSLTNLDLGRGLGLGELGAVGLGHPALVPVVHRPAHPTLALALTLLVVRWSMSRLDG